MVEKFVNPRGEYCSFERDTRTYWNGTDTDADSVALNELMPVDALIAQFYQASPWQGEAVDAQFAKRTHAVAADCICRRKTEITPKSEDERAAFSAVWQFASRIRDNNQSIEADKVAFSSFIGAAGMIDALFVCNNRIFVCDWQTGNIMIPAKCKMDAPFSYLVADPVTIYALRCSMLQVLLDAGRYFNNADFAPARLLWLHKENGAHKVDALTCRDLRREAAEMLLIRGYTRWYKDWQRRCPF